jgi:hypothetical protein
MCKEMPVISIEKSEAIACARRCRSSWLTAWWTRKELLEKMEGQEEGEAQVFF